MEKLPDAPDEIERRRDDALRRALNTPPQPRKAKGDNGKIKDQGQSNAPRKTSRRKRDSD